MLTLFLLMIFFAILFFFGWQTVRFLLQEKRIEALVPLAIIIGLSLYVLFLNLSSYFIDIKVNFYLVLAVFAAISIALAIINRKKEKPAWGIERKWRIILFGTAFLIVAIAGIIALRSESSDQMFYDHLPLAATIAEGNFPVRAAFAPDYFSQYHYGYNLSLAAITKVTGLPIWFSYDLQDVMLVGAIFLLGFLFIRDFFQNTFQAYIASLVMLLAGNLNILYGIGGISSLYQKYILGQPVDAPFRFISDIIFGKEIHGSIVAIYFESSWVMFGFALSLALTYLYFRAVHDPNNWLKISLLCAALFAFLALAAELFFAVLAAVLAAYPVAYALLKKDWKAGKPYFKISLLILFLGILLAFFQGGIITQTAKQIFLGQNLPVGHHFSISPEYLFRGLALVNVTDENVFVPLFGQDFIFGWGWVIFLIIPVSIYLMKKQPHIGLFLILSILIPFIIPLVVSAGISQGDFVDINYLSALLWNLSFGLFLTFLIIHFRVSWQRALSALLMLAVIFQGMVYLLLFSVFPDLQLDRPFLGEQMPELSATEQKALNWIKKQTEVSDRFLTFGEIDSGTYHNASFTIRTGRFAPDFLYWYNIQKGMKSRYDTLALEKSVYENILKSCDADSLELLGYDYLYVNRYWPSDLEEKCLKSGRLRLEFTDSIDGAFARIYKFN